jgi:hypothetical protein
VKIYDRKPKHYYRVAYHLAANATDSTLRPSGRDHEAEAKVSQLSRGDVDAVQLAGIGWLRAGNGCCMI